MIQQPDVLVVLYCTVSGENEDLLGVDETAITELNWMAINAVEKKVNMLNLFSKLFPPSGQNRQKNSLKESEKGLCVNSALKI